MNNAIASAVEMLNKIENKKDTSKQASFGDSRYKPIPFDVKHFHEIPADLGEKTIAAIDGGNIEIMSAPNFSLSLVRVAVSAYKNNKKIKLPIDEIITFYCLAVASNEGPGKITYKTQLFPMSEKHAPYIPDGQDLVFDSFDPTITSGNRVNISKMGGVARRFSEWKLAEIVSGVLEPGDIVVKDGSLQTGITKESIYSNKLYASVIKNSVVFCGVSKTSTLLTDTGCGLSGHIMKMAADAGLKKPWVYYPVCEIEHPDHRAEMYFVKLNCESRHCFRFEILKDQRQEAFAAITSLSKNSVDISFPGYPYALVDADRCARVRKNEIEHHRMMFLSMASKTPAWGALMHQASSTDAHGILDRMIR